MFPFAGRQFLRGFAMGSADIVPGVSGGTVAFVLGIYERLIAVVREATDIAGLLLRLRLERALARLRSYDWLFVVPLGLGVVSAVAVLSSLLGYLLDNHPVYIVAAFFGLVLGAIPVAWRNLRRPSGALVVLAGAVAIVTAVALGAQSGERHDVPAWGVFGSGMLAISAMILPGISGSFILVMLGMYEFILDSVSGLDVANLGVFLAGCVAGLALFAHLLSWLLDRYHDLIVAALVGLMAGSLRVIWPWPEGAENTALGAPELSQVPLALLCGALGLGAIWLLTRLEATDSRAPRPHAQHETAHTEASRQETAG